MRPFVRIEGRKDLIKDAKTGAILVTDSRKIDDYKEKKMIMQKQRERQEEINNMLEKVKEIDTIKDDIAEIKQLLMRILNK